VTARSSPPHIPKALWGVGGNQRGCKKLSEPISLQSARCCLFDHGSNFVRSGDIE
jgi:hypothetical protein